MNRFIVVLFLFSTVLFGEMKFSDPKPTFDSPRHWVVKIGSNDLAVMNHTLDAINNVMKEYPSESLKVAIVFYSKGMRNIMKNGDKATLERIKSIMQYDVEIIGCRNTMQTMGWKESEFIDNISYAQAGVAEVIERVVAGWIDVTPYQ